MAMADDGGGKATRYHLTSEMLAKPTEALRTRFGLAFDDEGVLRQVDSATDGLTQERFEFAVHATHKENQDRCCSIP